MREQALVPAADEVAAVQEEGDRVGAGVGGGDHHERLGHAGDLALVDVPGGDAVRTRLEDRRAHGHRGRRHRPI